MKDMPYPFHFNANVLFRQEQSHVLEMLAFASDHSCNASPGPAIVIQWIMWIVKRG